MTYKIITLGCKVNSCESAAVARSLEQSGYTPAEEGAPADVYIVNSCAVTGEAERKSRQAISRCKSENPDGITVLCGCYPQGYPDAARNQTAADIITGNAGKQNLPLYIDKFLREKTRGIYETPLPKEFEIPCSVPDNDRTRAFIKIEDGCDRFCAYCVIPLARGRVRSLPLEEVRKQARQCAEEGHKEIVLTGINLSCYGTDIDLSLSDAVKAAAESGIGRIRLGSLEPDMMTDAEIEALSSVPALCPHFHLSLQSGSDAVLKRMHRRYDTAQYKSVVEKLRAAFPGCSVTTDIIAGFVGESSGEHAETMAFVRETAFAGMHVFPYSPRAGTVSAMTIRGQMPPQIKTARARELKALAAELEADFFHTQVGKTASVLIERRTSPDFVCGHTPNFVPVRLYGAELPQHALADVFITGIREGCCVGRIG